ncbi:Uncharacterized protein APZ42_020678 [Daphnia magna]|uniref:Uncharacterized protein n=1 Tax=Daphnia magna TaxID=35525 RepID=A0A164XB55_9CRUS|nr:Uncharacterized protein APZ42_020678 [Daphnia magna]
MTPSEGKSEERDCESGSSVNPSAAANVFWKGRGEEEIVFFSLLGQLLWKRRCRFFVF